MDPWDWILAAAFVALLMLIGYFVEPRFGWLVMLPLGVFIIYRTLKRRNRMRDEMRGKKD